MIDKLFRCAVVACGLYAAAASAQTTLMPPECAGKTGVQLDECVRNITQPSVFGGFEPFEQTPDPSQLLNCLMVSKADEGFCIQRNEIILECRNRVKNPDFDACVSRLIGRPQLPIAADCSRLPAAQRNRCALRNKSFNECLSDPYRYFICLGDKMNAK